MKGVFETSGASRYDDLLSERYHFPAKYLMAAKQCVGDWIVYRETRVGGGRMSYVGAAFVERIDSDPVDPSRHYARVSNYREFDIPVPYRDGAGRFAERFLRELQTVGDAGRALRGASVRLLDEDDFTAIVLAGTANSLDPANQARLGLEPEYLDPSTVRLLEETPEARPVVQILINRFIRAASFRLHVLSAYGNTCSITGLIAVDGSGKAEAEAAHILPVSEGGPDTIRNGIALTSTVHWLFDRHIFSIDENYRVILKPEILSPRLLQPFPAEGKTIGLPSDPRAYPSQEFLAMHRKRFKAQI